VVTGLKGSPARASRVEGVRCHDDRFDRFDGVG
jgi:hypothetical protein